MLLLPTLPVWLTGRGACAPAAKRWKSGSCGGGGTGGSAMETPAAGSIRLPDEGGGGRGGAATTRAPSDDSGSVAAEADASDDLLGGEAAPEGAERDAESGRPAVS